MVRFFADSNHTDFVGTLIRCSAATGYRSPPVTSPVAAAGRRRKPNTKPGPGEASYRELRTENQVRPQRRPDGPTSFKRDWLLATLASSSQVYSHSGNCNGKYHPKQRNVTQVFGEKNASIHILRDLAFNVA